MRIFDIFREGTGMAWHALRSNKLRAFLSVLGITIGIFCIVVVYALVHSLEKNLNDSFSGMGKDVIYVQKWPWDEFGNNYPWWKYLGRPQTTPEEAIFLEENLDKKLFQGIAFSFQEQGNVEYGKLSLSNSTLRAISYGYNAVQKVNVEQGRYFSLQEIESGRNVAVIGSKIASELFNGSDPVGKQIRIKNQPCTIIGVCAAEGQSLIDLGSDEVVFLPVNFVRGFSNYREGEKGCQILLKASEGIELDDLGFEVGQQMRRFRRLKPHADANFSVNRISMITSMISTFFGSVKIIGLIIGGFAMLVGCFGAANIMFVSVKERTQEIGIQKALGARRSFILIQFLLESVLLCIVGGFVGMILVWLVLQAGNYLLIHSLQSSMKLFLSVEDINLGVIVSVLVGLISGFLPASGAARLNPVDAIRYK